MSGSPPPPLSSIAAPAHVALLPVIVTLPLPWVPPMVALLSSSEPPTFVPPPLVLLPVRRTVGLREKMEVVPAAAKPATIQLLVPDMGSVSEAPVEPDPVMVPAAIAVTPEYWATEHTLFTLLVASVTVIVAVAPDGATVPAQI
jgi:hypothetical protein